MPTTLACNAHQRPIGQGGFYSATLQIRNRDVYTFVYDCGSLTDATRLSDEIAEFSRELRHRPLDLLVLSHLDADHVNGVDELLRTTHGVKDVFLPYLSPLERAIYVARYPNQPESYYNLLADPVATLRGLGAENVYLVGESNGDGDGDQFGQNDPGPDFLKRLNDLPALKLETDRLVAEKRIDAAHAAESGQAAPAPAKGISDAGAMTISGLWRLRMFQKQGLRAAIEKVVAAGNYGVVPATGESNDERRCREFLGEIEAALGGQPVTNQSILQTLRTEKGRKALRTAYQKVSSVHNEVSLCLWHGPAFTASPSRVFHAHASGATAMATILGACWRRCHSWFHREGEVGCLLTGDIALKGVTLTKFKKHYAWELPSTWLLQIPHHGSRYNVELDGDLFDDGHRLGFTSAGLRNSYLHPHLDVIECLHYGFDFDVLWSHERRGVGFFIEVTFS
ncbi:MAG: MBL fold metallo-hydrolase [Opitutae bacterium]|nr:MBL fold metallo-hydrolase [Opitutae bacterium]